MATARRRATPRRRARAPHPSPDVAAHLSAAKPALRAVLKRLRADLFAAAPGAVDAISYQMPAMRVDGRTVVAYAAFAQHVSLFPMSTRVMETLAGELGDRVTSKGTIRAGPERPLPARLVARIVKVRLEELAARKRR